MAEAPEMFGAPGDAVVVEGEDENGQWFRSFHVTYPQSKGIYARDDGSILNVVLMEDDDRTVWQLYSALNRRGEGDGRGALLAETAVDRAYTPWFQMPNGDVLAHRREPDTSAPTVVRLRVRLSSP